MSQGFGRGLLASRGRWSGAIVYNSTTQAISHNTPTTLTFDSETIDTDAYHDTGSNTGRLTAPVAGIYLAVADVAWDSNATAARALFMRVDGTTSRGGTAIDGALGSDVLSAPLILSLTAGQYVEARVYQNSGGERTITAQFAITRLG